MDPNPNRTDFFGYVAKYRHEQGLRAGDTSQLGQVLSLLLESVATNNGSLNKADFLVRLDALFETLNGESLGGRSPPCVRPGA